MRCVVCLCFSLLLQCFNFSCLAPWWEVFFLCVFLFLSCVFILLVLASDEMFSFSVFFSSLSVFYSFCSVLMSSLSLFFYSCYVLLFFMTWDEMSSVYSRLVLCWYLLCLCFSLLCLCFSLLCLCFYLLVLRHIFFLVIYLEIRFILVEDIFKAYIWTATFCRRSFDLRTFTHFQKSDEV